MNIPRKLSISNIPTPIHSLQEINLDTNWSTLYIKRDDYSGFETSGNKIRKLEYHFCEAMELGANIIITCGGLQSNHARAVASLSARFSLGCHLVLKEATAPPDGNYLFNLLFGAKIKLVTNEEYVNNRTEVMYDLGENYKQAGYIPYIIPEGGSDGLGMFGYYNAYIEILCQERELGINFDAICVADGSGGTYAGLYAANEIICGKKARLRAHFVQTNLLTGKKAHLRAHFVQTNLLTGKKTDLPPFLSDRLQKNCKSNFPIYKKIVGFNVYSNDCVSARKKIKHILDKGIALANISHAVDDDNIYQNFDYLGSGYGEVYPELIEFIHNAAKSTGIIFDPVYTGKALLGTVSEIKKNNPLLKGNVLFIHTGGQFGIFPRKELFL